MNSGASHSVKMYGGDLSGGAATGGSSWKAPEDPTLVVGSKEEVIETQN